MIDTRTIPARLHHLRAMGRSPAHGRHALLGAETPPTMAMRLGAGLHAMLLGQPYAVWDSPSKASEKSGKPSKAPRNGAEWEAFRAANADRVILSAREHATAQAMLISIMECEPAREILTRPAIRFEQTLYWSQCGRSRRSTPDAVAGCDAARLVVPGRAPLVNLEIKTTRSAAPLEFARDAERRGYHCQLADQADAIEACYGRRPDRSMILAIETTPPHVVQLYELPHAMLDQGRIIVQTWLERLQMCEATGQWPGYSDRIETLMFGLDYGVPVDLVADEIESAQEGEAP